MNYSKIAEYINNNVIEKLLKERIIVKNKEKALLLPETKNYIFEKTKTLTVGEFRITEVETENEEELFYYLNYGEYFSKNRIKEAVRTYREIEVNPKKIKDYAETPNRGVTYKLEDKQVHIGNFYYLKENGIEVEKNLSTGTIIYVAVDKNMIGSIVISDGIKYSTKEIISYLLKRNSKHLAVISSDNERIVTAISRELKIKDHYSNLTLDEKKFWIRHIIEENPGITAFIGSEDTKKEVMDEADISICLIPSISKIKNKADIYLLNNDFTKLVRAFEIIEEGNILKKR